MKTILGLMAAGAVLVAATQVHADNVAWSLGLGWSGGNGGTAWSLGLGALFPGHGGCVQPAVSFGVSAPVYAAPPVAYLPARVVYAPPPPPAFYARPVVYAPPVMMMAPPPRMMPGPMYRPGPGPVRYAAPMMHHHPPMQYRAVPVMR